MMVPSHSTRSLRSLRSLCVPALRALRALRTSFDRGNLGNFGGDISGRPTVPEGDTVETSERWGESSSQVLGSNCTSFGERAAHSLPASAQVSWVPNLESKSVLAAESGASASFRTEALPVRRSGGTSQASASAFCASGGCFPSAMTSPLEVFSLTCCVEDVSSSPWAPEVARTKLRSAANQFSSDDVQGFASQLL